MHFEIREYNKPDWPEIVRLFKAAKQDELKGAVDADQIVGLEDDKVLLKSFRESNIFVAANGHEIIGCVGNNEDLISFLFVDPRHYRKGIASALLKFILSRCKNPWLLTAKTNAPAISLYKSFGFSIVDEFSGNYNNVKRVKVLKLVHGNEYGV